MHKPIFKSEIDEEKEETNLRTPLISGATQNKNKVLRKPFKDLTTDQKIKYITAHLKDDVRVAKLSKEKINILQSKLNKLH